MDRITCVLLLLIAFGAAIGGVQIVLAQLGAIAGVFLYYKALVSEVPEGQAQIFLICIGYGFAAGLGSYAMLQVAEQCIF
jgi:hypothetical protein